MKYLVIDASLHGTGIRDLYKGGYIAPERLRLTNELVSQIQNWVLKYENEHFNGFNDSKLVDALDYEGKLIAKEVQNQLIDVKVSYFSNAKLKYEAIE